MGTLATVRLIEGVCLIRYPLNTGFAVILLKRCDIIEEVCLRGCDNTLLARVFIFNNK